LSKRAVISISLVLIFVLLVIAAHAWETPPRAPENSLRWGGDATGGAPYVFEDDGERTGFENDLAEYLAQELEMEPWFVQQTWEQLPARLNRGDIDVVLNGYEWSEEREREWASTIPYYVYSLKLLVSSDQAGDEIQTWEDLHKRPNGRRYSIGVLANSAAQRYLEKEFGGDVDVVAYSEGVTSAMKKVIDGSLDATVQDFPAVVYYYDNDKEENGFKDNLRVVEPDRTVAPGYYVMFVRHDQHALRDKLNRAIRDGLEFGKLKEIYSAYDIWTDDQEERLTKAAEHWPPSRPPAMSAGLFNGLGTKLTEDWREHLKVLGRAALTTVLLSFISMPIAMLIGLMVAVGRLYGPTLLSKVLGLYVEFLRGTPLLMQLYFIFFVLPDMGIALQPFWAGVLGLAINYSAYEAENYRAGLLAVPHGQMEAALSLGMTRWSALRRIVIPQAVRIVIPPVTNDFIALFKDTSVCSIIAVTELTSRYNQLLNNQPSALLQVAIMTAVLYLLMSIPLSILARRLERKFPRLAI
jgi:polar amino acid transport system substrate-binding protein